ncbi:MAG: ATP-binding cassette domain-containing protein, partial [Erysipelotrichaceae bacterium]|nr:ATP-binding cassette domain-containing protein [Erysipelotrichaceae bacterium]
MAYIEFSHVYKEYGSGEAVIKALDDADFIVEKGELAVILGSSGAGKTTALNILGGMDRATKGSVRVDGTDITELKKKQLVAYRRHDIGFVFQFYNLVPNLTALENVELAVQVCDDHLDPRQTLEKVGLGARTGNFPSQLSGGE